MVGMPLPAMTSDNGLAPDVDELVREIQARGGKKITTLHFPTDRSWSDRRITLAMEIANWLQGLL